MARHFFDAIGTVWEIRSESELSPSTVSQVHERIESFDATYSRFRGDSLVRRVAAAPGEYHFPDDATALFELYRALYLATDGALTPLVGHALEQLGYDSEYSLRRRPGTAVVPDWDDVLQIDGPTVTTGTPVLLDLGAAGKGYLVDLVGELLARCGVGAFLVDGSGDLVHRGPASCRVGLENPLDPSQVIGVAHLQNTALCASAVNRRQWGDGLHHIIDPVTAEPVRGVLATWVVAGSALLADGLATALFLSEPAWLARLFDFEYVRMHDTGAVDFSTGFPGELFR